MKTVRITVELLIKTDPSDEETVQNDILQGVIDAIEDGTLNFHVEEDEESEDELY